MHGNADFLERRCVRIEELNSLIMFRFVLCRLHCLCPLLPLHLVDNLKAFLKHCPVLWRKSVKKCTVSNENIWYHLMHVIRIVLTYIPVAIGSERHLIVLRPVNDL